MTERELGGLCSPENAIEWITGDRWCCISASQPKLINRLKALAKTHKEVRDPEQNLDGSICVNVPVSWIKINPPREISDEKREAMRERGKERYKNIAPKTESKTQDGINSQESKSKGKSSTKSRTIPREEQKPKGKAK